MFTSLSPFSLLSAVNDGIESMNECNNLLTASLLHRTYTSVQFTDLFITKGWYVELQTIMTIRL